MRATRLILKGAFALLLSVPGAVLGGTPYPFNYHYPFSAWATQFSRWMARPLEGVHRYLQSSSDGSVLVAARNPADALRSLDAGLTWEPFTIAGQMAFEVIFAPSSATTWYAFAPDGGLYRTTDAAQSWTRRGTQLASPLSLGLLSVSADPNVVYATRLEVQDPCDFNECPYVGSTLQVSTDAGATWRSIGERIQWEESLGHAVQRAFASPIDSNLVYAVSAKGMSRSRDRGASWKPLTLPAAVSPAAFWGDLVLDRFDANIAYFVPLSYQYPTEPILSTRDAGDTWTVSSLPPGVLKRDPAQKGRAYLFADFGGAFETRDAGLTWVRVETGGYTSIDSGVGAVVVRGGQRIALNTFASTLRELDLTDGAVALASDLWWNPSESGWGMTITHRASTQTFVAWFTYDEAGNAVWRVMSGGRWQDRTFTGDVYQTTGPAYFGGPFDPSDVSIKKVGAATIRFDTQDSALFSYQLTSGESANKRIERQRFGPAVTQPVVDESFADLWWNAAESGWGISISHQGDNIFATWFVYDDQGKPLWVVMTNAKVVIKDGVPTAAGDIYTTHGPSSRYAFDPSKVVLTKVGTASLTFRPGGDAVLDSTAFGKTESRVITRQPF